MAFLKPRVSFSSNFASLFSVMRRNSSVLFHPKLYMLWKKGAHQSANFKTFDFSHRNSLCPCSSHEIGLLSALMKVHPIPHASFETERSGFILHHCSVSWKITPLYFWSPNLVYFGQKEPIEKKFPDFWVVGWKFTKFLMSHLKPQVSFSLNFASIFSVMRDNSSVLF